MPDSAEILQNLYAAGFDIQSFDRFPRAIGVSKGECIALLEPDDNAGLRILGRPGWKIEDAIGVLTSHSGRPVFQWKNPAWKPRRSALRCFKTSKENSLVS